MTTISFLLHDPGPTTASTLPPPPSRTARQLALAYVIEQLVDDGVITNYAEAARRWGVSRARVSQIVGLLTLPLEEQEAVLLGGHDTVSH